MAIKSISADNTISFFIQGKSMVKFQSLVVINLLIYSTAYADWKVITTTDAITDKVEKSAIVKNELGHSFSIYSIEPGGAVWGNFALSEEVIDQIDSKKPPIYRIDKNEPADLSSAKKRQELQKEIGIIMSQTYSWNPKWVNFAIWHGNEDEGIAEKLVEVMEGEKILFRYYLSTGGYKETTFDLKGADKAISEAIGIPAKIDHAEQKMVIEFYKAVNAEIPKCVKNVAELTSCTSRITKCKDQANKNIESFKSCMENEF